MATTDQQVMEQIQYAVIEPPDQGQTWPSGLWSMTEVVNYLTQRQNRFIRDTAVQIGISDYIPTLQGTYAYDLPDDWIQTVGVVWFNANGIGTELIRSDSWEADLGIPSWPTTQAPPKLFMDSSGPTLTIRIAPVPDQAGNLQIYYIPIAPDLTGAGEILIVPDEIAIPVLKYGAMADMLWKVARAMDPRAQYCEQRYTLGIELTKMLLSGWTV